MSLGLKGLKKTLENHCNAQKSNVWDNSGYFLSENRLVFYFSWETCMAHASGTWQVLDWRANTAAISLLLKNWQTFSGYLGSEELVVALAGQCWTYSFTLVKVVAEDIQALHNNHSSNDSIGGGNSWNNVTGHG